MNTDDPILVGMYFSRDERALHYTRKTYGRYCRSVAKGILRDPLDVEECENDVYHILWNRIPPDIPQCFRTYLGNVTRKMAIDRQRKLQAKKRGTMSTVMMELDDLIGVGSSPEKALEGEEIRELLRRFLAGLTLQAQDMFVQRYWYLKDVASIAEMHRCSEEKVRTALFRTRKALEKILTEEGYL